MTLQSAFIGKQIFLGKSLHLSNFSLCDFLAFSLFVYCGLTDSEACIQFMVAQGDFLVDVIRLVDAFPW